MFTTSAHFMVWLVAFKTAVAVEIQMMRRIIFAISASCKEVQQ
jgi:hypothetical protein